MDQIDIEAANHDLIQRFLKRVRPGEMIAGIVTVRPPDDRKVIWYPVDQDKSNQLLDGLAQIERLP